MDLFFNENVQANAGFRLQYLEVLNWGTFNKASWRIEPGGNNALLTGDIGSGKSTLVDAITCLLVPTNKITFNKAAGAVGKERNLLTYVRGDYKKEKGELSAIAKPVYLRAEGNTYSVIIGGFHNEGYNEDICLAHVYWINKEGKVDRLFIISTKPLTIAEHFSGFADMTDLRKRLRNAAGVQLFNDNFTQYSEQFRRLFGMNSEKAIDLFYQTVSMKSVSSLTDFVREQMLEKTDVKEQIGILLKRFEHLKKAHDEVVNSREQYQILKPLTENSVEYGIVGKEIEKIEMMLEYVPAWFATEKKKLLADAIEHVQAMLVAAENLSDKLEEEKQDLDSKHLGILQDIDNNGGKRIEQIEGEIRQHERDSGIKEKEHKAYDILVKNCGLQKVETEVDFIENISEAKKIHTDCLIEEQELKDQRDDLKSEFRKANTELQEEKIELQSLRERQTQIPRWLIQFRTQLCLDLQINEEKLPFAGELLQVDENELEWEGAIEKLLRDTGKSMLVPIQFHRSVIKYINDNIVKSQDGKGIKITCLEVDFNNHINQSARLDDDSVVNKVQIKPDTEFYDWIENYLQRSFGSFLCVEVSDLQHVAYGITKKGMIKSGKIKYTKDDTRRIDYRRDYVLGWSNADKIKLLENLVADLEKKVYDHEKKIDQIEALQKKNEELKLQLSYLLYVTDYVRINWKYHVEKIHDLEKEKFRLLNENDKLALLNKQKEEVLAALINLSARQKENSEETGGYKTKKDLYEKQLLEIDELLSLAEPEKSAIYFPAIEEKCTDKNFSLSSIDKYKENFKKLFEGPNGELSKLRHKLGMLRSAVEKKMREIKNHSAAEYSELGESIDARPEYIKKFEKLVAEDLKRHEERFKDELTKNTINSISVFDNQLEMHEKDIKQKIRIINQHLNEIVYNAVQGTYITILIEANPENKDIRLFREELKKCYTHSFSSNTDLYTEEKYEQVKRILDRFASAESFDKEWTNTVTDVRQWFVFNASERFAADHTEKEFYEGSGGKSGGQKEKLAYTILASALAYQFGLQFGEVKSRSFRFVVIDEAFGRGSDESTRYGLELFKKLNLQLLIVTPLQKIHIIEGHVNSFHFVSNRDGNNSQVSNFTKGEYMLEKAKHNSLFTAGEDE